MLNEKKSYQLIIEEPYFSPVEILNSNNNNTEIQIIKEEYDRTNKIPKVRFRAILQEADVINKNRRKYPKQVLQEVVNTFNNIIKYRGGILGEVNHPLVEDEKIAKQRMARIDISNVGVIYKKFDFDGKYVIAEAVTASTQKGRDIYGLIVEDGYNLGFSLRALGTVKPVTESDGNVIYVVEHIYKPVTYDIVDNPSHAVARIINISEDEILTKDNSKILTENTDTIKIPIGGYTINEEVLNYAKDDIDLAKVINSILEDSYEININGDTVRICNDDRCIVTDLKTFIDTIINTYFPTDKPNKDIQPMSWKCIRNQLMVNTDNLLSPQNRFRLLSYLLGKPKILLPVINNTSDILYYPDIKESDNNNTELFNNDSPILENILMEDTEAYDYIVENIDSIEEYEKLIEEIEQDLDILLHYYLLNGKYEDINEILNNKTLEEEIEFYLVNLLDNRAEKDKVKKLIENEINNIAKNIVVD